MLLFVAARACFADNRASQTEPCGCLNMMMKRDLCMLATSAIAAALAISTPGAAQQVQPVPADPAPATTVAPTTTDVLPPLTDTAPAAAPAAGTASNAPPSTAETKPATTAAKRASTTSSAAANRRAEAQSLARTLAARKAAAARAASPAPAATPPVAAPAVAPATAEAAPAPKPAPAQPAGGIDERTLELGGGALALLALGAGAAALIRRRRSDDEEVWTGDEAAYHEQPSEEPLELDEKPVVAAAPAVAPRHDPVPDEPAFIAPPPSAFAWNAAPRHDSAQAADDADDRLPGESWVERAHRGPSPSNPSLSLKKRLKRAAFFDQRERDVAEGRAVPVEADAGLPEALELEDA